MAKKLDKGKLLRDIEGEERFFVNDGSVIGGLKRLPGALDEMSDEVFAGHKGRDDFSNWVRDVCGDEKLARDLSLAKTRTAAAKKAQTRVDMLQK